MVGGKQVYANCEILWLVVRKFVLTVKYCGWGKQVYANCEILWLGVSKFMLTVKYCGWG